MQLTMVQTELSKSSPCVSRSILLLPSVKMSWTNFADSWLPYIWALVLVFRRNVVTWSHNEEDFWHPRTSSALFPLRITGRVCQKSTDILWCILVFELKLQDLLCAPLCIHPTQRDDTFSAFLHCLSPYWCGECVRCHIKMKLKCRVCCPATRQ